MIEKDMIDVNVVVKITTESLQAVVANARKIVGPNVKGHYQVDTADMLGQVMSSFLLENDFESYAKDIHNYRRSD